ncbi:hypothetical protein [Gudongella sp. SC589]|uniref:hypothetical protein n=1 Tax=Gudongella sp. SC589 TaxID=3385990 RepID=UPI0039049FD2
MVVILVFALFVIPNWMDKNTNKTIMEDITEIENLLKTYLKDNEGISVGLRTDIDVEAMVILKQVYNSEGVIESLDLSKDYNHVPGLINALVDTKLNGNFICDAEGTVYYIHDRALR